MLSRKYYNRHEFIDEIVLIKKYLKLRQNRKISSISQRNDLSTINIVEKRIRNYIDLLKKFHTKRFYVMNVFSIFNDDFLNFSNFDNIIFDRDQIARISYVEQTNQNSKSLHHFRRFFAKIFNFFII